MPPSPDAKAEPAEPAENAVLAGIARIFREALTCRSEEELGRVCLAVAEAVTRSRFGFIGEIAPETDEMDVVAVSDPGWDACRIRDPSGPGRCGSPSLEVHGLVGRVLHDGRSLIANDPAAHPDRIGAPPGLPPLLAFLGVPLIDAGETVGMIGLGNREGGYGPRELAAAEGLAPAIVQAFRSKRAEIALRESEARLRRIAQAGRIGFVEWNAATDTAYWSPEHYALLGLVPGSPLGWDRWLEGVHPDDRERVATSLARLLASARAQGQVQGHQDEYRCVRPDGSVVWLEADISVDMVAGEPIVRGAVREITERRAAESRLAYLASFPERSPHPIVEADAAGGVRYANPAALRLFPDLAEKGSAHPWLADWGSLARRLQEGTAAIETREIAVGERLFRQTLVLAPAEAVVRVYGTDLTERQRAEALARRTLAELEDIYRHAPIGLCVLDRDLRWVRINERLAEMNGIPAADHIGKRLRELLPELADTVESELLEVLRSGRPRFDVEVVTRTPAKPGVLRTWREHWLPIVDAEGQVVGLNIVAEEITKRKKAQKALRASELRYRTLVEATGAVTWSCPPSGLQVEPQPAWMAFTGQTAEEMMGSGWVQAVHPDDRAAVAARWAAAVAAGEPFSNEQRIRRHDGTWRWVSVYAAPIRASGGRVVEWIGMNLDIDARKRAEDRLREGDRRKDEFLATLAHELRNPLAPIRNSCSILKLAGPADPTVQAAGDMIDRQVRHLVRLVDDLTDISRITRGKLALRTERVDLRGIIERAVELVRPSIEAAGHRLAVSLPTGPLPLDGDPVRLAQVFANLLDNACKYTPGGGLIRLGVEREGAALAASVEDSGIGIAPEHLPQVFDMFHQAPAGAGRIRSGLGIGLSLVRGLVEMHGGHIVAESGGLGQGSTFVVRLPAAAQQPISDPSPSDEASAARPTATARVLIADDNADALESLALLLRLHGNDVATARDGLEAVAAAERFRPDLVLLDLGMPNLDGLGACRHMRERPWGKGLTIVATTGWGQESDRRRTEEAGFDAHLVKPVTPAALLDLLAQARGGGAP